MKLFDQFGNEFTPENKPEERVLAVASIRDRFGDYPSQGLTPKKLASIFKEADAGDPWQQAQLFEEMEEKDTHLFSILSRRKGAVAGLDYEIVPASQSKSDVEVRDFVEDVITGLSGFEDHLKDIADAIGKGYSGLELYWTVRNNRHVVRHMEWIEPRRFTWVNSVTPKLRVWEGTICGIDLPQFKFIFHKHKTKSGSPMRQGVLRVCAWMYLFKNYSVKDWVQFAEIFGMPLRLGKYDPGATALDKQALVAAVRSLGADAAGIISKSTEIEFIETIKNASGDLYKLLAGFCNEEMSKAVLGQTLTTQQGENGARALGQVHKQVEDEIQKDDCEQISKTLRRDLFLPLVGFNFGWDVPLPWFKFGYEDVEDLKSEAERYKIHLDSGVRIGEDHYYEKFDIPKPEEGETVIVPLTTSQNDWARQAAPLQNKMNCPGCGVLVARGTSPVNEDQKDLVDHLTDRALQSADLDPWLKQIEKIMNESGSLEDFRNRLLDAYKGMDPVDLGNLLQRAFTTAELAGRFVAGQGAGGNAP